jgi:murein DD-endopeptidase MepM/ murein hydrolase activator NlpD
MRQFVDEWIGGYWLFLGKLNRHFLVYYLHPRFRGFERVKDFVVGKLYEQRGKNARVVINGAVLSVMVTGVAVGPSLVVNDSMTRAVITTGVGTTVFAQGNEDEEAETRVLGYGSELQVQIDPMTKISDKPRSDVFDYQVASGETLGGIAKKFGVDIDSIKWINPGLDERKIKEGSSIKIPPVSGVVHTVKSGETIYSVAKKYGVSAQAIVDFPFNEFTNDETFAIAIGQSLVVPDGEMPAVVVSAPRTARDVQQITPNAGAVSATGSWIWPAAGRITQPFRPWHKGLDIANKDGGNILAADSGTVIVAGWPDNTGYGNRVVIDHGNGYKTLYAHLSKVSVSSGQTVRRGDVIGGMGSTGRSTGTHLHFEIRKDQGGNQNPALYLK